MLRLRVGIVLWAVSCLVWVLLLGLPWLGGSVASMAAAAGVLVTVAELLFWLGVMLMGKAVWQAARAQGWRALPRVLWHGFTHGDARQDDRAGVAASTTTARAEGGQERARCSGKALEVTTRRSQTSP